LAARGRAASPEWGAAVTSSDHPIVHAVSRLALAFLLVLPLGWEREQRSRSAGLRTYPLVSVCVCGFLLLAQQRAGGAGEQADVFYGVLSGIGFVGSGVVLKSPSGAAGMTTAVSLWVTGAIGAGVAYELPLISTALSILIVLALSAPSVLRRLRRPS
jgi:putative Mg2+ transporter-C (MgtC) family protein